VDGETFKDIEDQGQAGFAARHRHKSMGCHGVQGSGPCQKARRAFCGPCGSLSRVARATDALAQFRAV
jgi:hypothetical protein